MSGHNVVHEFYLFFKKPNITNNDDDEVNWLNRIFSFFYFFVFCSPFSGFYFVWFVVAVINVVKACIINTYCLWNEEMERGKWVSKKNNKKKKKKRNETLLSSQHRWIGRFIKLINAWLVHLYAREYSCVCVCKMRSYVKYLIVCLFPLCVYFAFLLHI